MKLMQIAVHFEYTDDIEAILDRHDVQQFIQYPMMEGKDSDGKHQGTQVYPGNVTVFHAQVDPSQVDPLFNDLQQFRSAKSSHHHLQALVVPIERNLAAEHPLDHTSAAH